MAFEYGFYNSISGDRKYNALDFGKVFDGVITDGVFADIGDKMFTTPGTLSMEVLVGTGKAWFNHTWNLNTSPISFIISASHPVLTRYDAIVLEVNETQDVYGRVNEIKVVEGVPSSNAVKPTLVETEHIHQHPLAYIKINPEATTIVAADIEITVGQTACPFVTSIIQQTDITTLFANWESQFDIWFTNLKTQLTDDVVTNLQNQIDNCLKTTDIATQADIDAGTAGKVVTAPFMKTTIDEMSYKVGDTLSTWRTDLGDNWLLCNGDEFDPEEYPELASVTPELDTQLSFIKSYITDYTGSTTLLITGMVGFTSDYIIYSSGHGATAMKKKDFPGINKYDITTEYWSLNYGQIYVMRYFKETDSVGMIAGNYDNNNYYYYANVFNNSTGKFLDSSNTSLLINSRYNQQTCKPVDITYHSGFYYACAEGNDKNQIKIIKFNSGSISQTSTITLNYPSGFTSFYEVVTRFYKNKLIAVCRNGSVYTMSKNNTYKLFAIFVINFLTDGSYTSKIISVTPNSSATSGANIGLGMYLIEDIDQLNISFTITGEYETCYPTTVLQYNNISEITNTTIKVDTTQIKTITSEKDKYSRGVPFTSIWEYASMSLEYIDGYFISTGNSVLKPSIDRINGISYIIKSKTLDFREYTVVPINWGAVLSTIIKTSSVTDTNLFMFSIDHTNNKLFLYELDGEAIVSSGNNSYIKAYLWAYKYSTPKLNSELYTYIKAKEDSTDANQQTDTSTS